MTRFAGGANQFDNVFHSRKPMVDCKGTNPIQATHRAKRFHIYNFFELFELKKIYNSGQIAIIPKPELPE